MKKKVSRNENGEEKKIMKLRTKNETWLRKKGKMLKE